MSLTLYEEKLRNITENKDKGTFVFYDLIEPWTLEEFDNLARNKVFPFHKVKEITEEEYLLGDFGKCISLFTANK